MISLAVGWTYGVRLVGWLDWSSPVATLVSWLNRYWLYGINIRYVEVVLIRYRIAKDVYVNSKHLLQSGDGRARRRQAADARG